MNDKYWQQRWEEGNTPWDMGSPSPALVEYCKQLRDKNIAILIPGAGSGYEVDWLWENGFHNVTALDFSPQACERMLDRLGQDFSAEKIVCGDFFSQNGNFDLILEQTFLSALDPKQRRAYAIKLFSLLREGGTIAGVLFDFPLDGGPPFGGDELSYRELFKRLFDVKVMARCYNSIKPREGRELFFILKKCSFGE